MTLKSVISTSHILPHDPGTTHVALLDPLVGPLVDPTRHTRGLTKPPVPEDRNPTSSQPQVPLEKVLVEENR